MQNVGAGAGVGVVVVVDEHAATVPGELQQKMI